MTDIPAAAYFSNPARTNQQAKTAQDAMLAVLRELLGGSAETTLTIAGGAVTPTAALHAIDTEGAAASDDLTNILTTNHPEGRLLVISPASDARDVVVKHAAGGAGQILLADGADLTLSDSTMHLVLKRVGTDWKEVDRSYGKEKAAARSFLGSEIPPGVIVPYAGSSPPTGWLLCYGQAVSRTTYAALFAAIDTTYGSGDGSTTFNLPDLRGRAVFGRDNMGGASSGRITQAVSGMNANNLGATGGDQRTQSHTHSFSATTSSGGGHAHQLPVKSSEGVTTALSTDQTNVFNMTSISTSSAGDHTHSVSGTTGASGSGGSQNMPPAIILNYIIKT